MAALVTAVLIVGGSIVCALAVLWMVHQHARPMLVGVDHDVAGFIYALIAVIYGIALAFVTFAVWERFSAAGQTVTTEAAMVVAAYRDTETFPPRLRTEGQQTLRDYVKQVTAAEWTTHVGGGAHRTPDRLNAVWDVWNQARPKRPEPQQRYDNVLERLHGLEEQRHMRHLSVEATLPGVFWPVLIIGAMITVGFSFLFRMNSVRTQAIITAAVTALVAGSLFLIMSLNRPFTGIETVSREPFQHALQQFHAIDLRAPEQDAR